MCAGSPAANSTQVRAGVLRQRQSHTAALEDAHSAAVAEVARNARLLCMAGLAPDGTVQASRPYGFNPPGTGGLPSPPVLSIWTLPRTGGRVVDGTALEMRRPCKRFVGSNPTLSAIFANLSLTYQCVKRSNFVVTHDRTHEAPGRFWRAPPPSLCRPRRLVASKRQRPPTFPTTALDDGAVLSPFTTAAPIGAGHTSTKAARSPYSRSSVIRR